MRKKQILITILLMFLTSVINAETVYENAEDGQITRWRVFDHNPNGAAIFNSLDADRKSNVIEFKGSEKNNGYMLGNKSGRNGAWNNTVEKNIQWSMKYNESFSVIIMLNTQKGHRKLIYSSREGNRGLSSNGKHIHYGLGKDKKDGAWKIFRRNLEKDLKRYESDNTIISTNAFRIRGSGKVDNIILLNDSEVDEYHQLTKTGTHLRLRTFMDKVTSNVKRSILKLTHGYQSEVEVVVIDAVYDDGFSRGDRISGVDLVPSKDGGYSVFWMRYSQTSDESLYVSTYDNNGGNILKMKYLETYAPGGTSFDAAVLRNGTSVVAACLDADGGTVYVTLFDKQGTFIKKITGFRDSEVSCDEHKMEVITLINGCFLVSSGDEVKIFDHSGNEL